MSSAPSFNGFITGGTAVALPAQLFVELLPQIDDEAELRVTLYALYAIGRRKGELRAIRASQLASELPLRESLANFGGESSLAQALQRAVARGTLLACALEDNDELYFVNTEAGRRNLLRVRSGALSVPGSIVSTGPALPEMSIPAKVYEQEIGMLTPGVAEALGVAAERYPEDWIAEALRLAARHNARSWAYAEAILLRWESEGRGGEDGEASNATAGTDLEGAAQRDHGPYERIIRRG